MGRTVKPPELKAIEGGRDRRKLRQVAPIDIPVPKSFLGDAPASAFLSERQKEVWTLITSELPPGLLKSVDQYVIVQFCRAVALADLAAKSLQSSPVILKTDKGAIMQSPWVGIQNTQSKQIKALAAELGLSPAARTRISMGDAGDEDDPTAKYFA